MRFPFLVLTALLLMIPRPGHGADQESPVPVCAIGTPGAPIHEPDRDSRFGWKGLFVETLDRVLVQDLGLGLTSQPYPWKRAQKQVEDGTLERLAMHYVQPD